MVDSLLSPEMRSTGEVMGLDKHYDTAFAKAQAGAGSPLPTSGKVFISVANHDKRNVIIYAKMLESLASRSFRPAVPLRFCAVTA